MNDPAADRLPQILTFPGTKQNSISVLRALKLLTSNEILTLITEVNTYEIPLYEVQVMQWGTGDFLGSISRDDPKFTIKEAARVYAQEQSNKYGAITRVAEYGMDNDKQYDIQRDDYFWPRKEK